MDMTTVTSKGNGKTQVNPADVPIGDAKGTLEATAIDYKAEIERLKAENARLLAAKSRVWFKVSEKGALSVYGLGRFPVTLYREQWERLFGLVDAIRAFIRENYSLLKSKGE